MDLNNLTVLRLLTFGGLSLSLDGAELICQTPRGRLLPMLALLAASGQRGVTRERLATLLWPESEPQRARHSLEETISRARRLARMAGRDDLFVNAQSLSLDPAGLTADVWDFEAALAQGQVGRAASISEGRRFAAGVLIEGCDELNRQLGVLAAQYESHLAGAAARYAASGGVP